MKRAVQASAVLCVVLLSLMACGRDEAAPEELESQRAGLGIVPAAALPPIPPKVRVTTWTQRPLWPSNQENAVNFVGRNAKTPGLTRVYGVDPRNVTFLYCYEFPDSEYGPFMKNVFEDFARAAPGQKLGGTDGGMPASLLANGPIDDFGGPGGGDPYLNYKLMSMARNQANAIR